MPGYQNVMEILVEQMYSSIESTLDCCACPLCKADIIRMPLASWPSRTAPMPTRRLPVAPMASRQATRLP